MTRMQSAKAPGTTPTKPPVKRSIKPSIKPAKVRNRRSASAVVHDAELDAMLAHFELSNIVSHLLRRAHFRAEEIFAQQAGDRLKLTPRQKALLISCYRHPGANQSALAAHVAIDRNTVAEMVSRMVRTGLLSRSRNPNDARSNRVRITGDGIRMLKAIMPIDPLIETAVVEPLPGEYRPLFLKCLRLMVGLDPAAGDKPGDKPVDKAVVDSLDGPR